MLKMATSNKSALTDVNSSLTVVANSSSTIQPNTTQSIPNNNETVSLSQLKSQEHDCDTSGTPYTLTTLSSASSDTVNLPLIGLPGPLFTIIHGLALLSLLTTVLVSIFLLVFLCSRDRKQVGGHRQRQTEEPKTSGKGTLQTTDKTTGRNYSVLAYSRGCLEKTKSNAAAYRLEDLSGDSCKKIIRASVSKSANSDTQ
jgi:hypothetical protein